MPQLHRSLPTTVRVAIICLSLVITTSETEAQTKGGNTKIQLLTKGVPQSVTRSWFNPFQIYQEIESNTKTPRSITAAEMATASELFQIDDKTDRPHNSGIQIVVQGWNRQPLSTIAAVKKASELFGVETVKAESNVDPLAESDTSNELTTYVRFGVSMPNDVSRNWTKILAIAEMIHPEKRLIQLYIPMTSHDEVAATQSPKITGSDFVQSDSLVVSWSLDPNRMAALSLRDSKGWVTVDVDVAQAEPGGRLQFGRRLSARQSSLRLHGREFQMGLRRSQNQREVESGHRIRLRDDSRWKGPAHLQSNRRKVDVASPSSASVRKRLRHGIWHGRLGRVWNGLWNG